MASIFDRSGKYKNYNNKVGTFLLSKSLDDVLEKTKESNDVRELLIFTG